MLRSAYAQFVYLVGGADLSRIVDLMRHLRGSETRRHVREEVPFYTGRKRTPTELIHDLP